LTHTYGLFVFPSITEGNTCIDLSSATNIKSVAFRSEVRTHNIDWIAIAIESIKSRRLEEVALYLPRDFLTNTAMSSQIPAVVYVQWLALDKVLLRYLTARSLKLKVVRRPKMDEKTFVDCVECLLPSLFGKNRNVRAVAHLVRMESTT
jgi:hypothetical protein